jgi:uncharacterized protein YjbI with pentapeptide repeats
MPEATGVSTGSGMPSGAPVMPARPPSAPHVVEVDVASPRTPRTTQRTPPSAVVDSLFALLQKGQIEDFNKLRMHGALDFRGRDFTGLNLRGVDFRNVDLGRAILRGCDLTDAKLQQAILDRADLSDSVLTRAKFFESSLKYAALDGVRDATGAEFHKAKMKGATLEGGNFSGAFFNEANLTVATLTRAKFIGAHMVDVRLMGSTLTETVFDGANMQRARMFQANGKDISFKGTNLVDAEAFQAYFTSTTTEGDKGPRLCFDGAWIKGFRHNGEVPEFALIKAKRSELPPEGFFPATPPPSIEKILVNGIPGSDKVLYDQAMSELNELIGLDPVKEKITKLIHHLMVSETRLQLGEPELEHTLHQIYLGNPGTGKTTVARIVAKLFFAIGAMKTPNLVEADRSKMVAEYQGQTARETNRVIDNSMGGTLIIDEAYLLKTSDNDSYGIEAIGTLNKRLEDDRRDFSCILTGYNKEMSVFLKSNSGLESRFPFTVQFDDYTTGQMIDILKLNLDKKHYRYSKEFLCMASVLIAACKIKAGERFGNGRAVRTIFEKMTWQGSSRLVEEGILATRDRDKILAAEPADLPYDEVIKMPPSALPGLSELRWKKPGSEGEVGIDEVGLDGEFPCLTKESYVKIEAAISAYKDEKSEEEAVRDYV